MFLLFVSLRVSSTKLSQRPLQSSGSSANTGNQQKYLVSLTVKTDTCLVRAPRFMNTSDEVRDLRLYRSFLQVLDHHVGYSSQVAHVASPGATLTPDIHRHIYYLQVTAQILRNIKRPFSIFNFTHLIYKTLEESSLLIKTVLTVFYRSPPTHQGSFEAADTSGRAASSRFSQCDFVETFQCQDKGRTCVNHLHVPRARYERRSAGHLSCLLSLPPLAPESWLL